MKGGIKNFKHVVIWIKHTTLDFDTIKTCKIVEIVERMKE